MGWDKDSLPEQQREKKITTIILIKRTHRVQFSHCPMLSSPLNAQLAPEQQSLYSCQLPHINTEHDVTQR